MRRELIDIVTSYLIPIVPAILLYGLFDSQNSAEVVRDNAGLKLGGPVALYFVLLLLALQ